MLRSFKIQQSLNLRNNIKPLPTKLWTFSWNILSIPNFSVPEPSIINDWETSTRTFLLYKVSVTGLLNTIWLCCILNDPSVYCTAISYKTSSETYLKQICFFFFIGIYLYGKKIVVFIHTLCVLNSSKQSFP